MNTDKQKEVIAYLLKVDEASKKMIYDNVSFGYYHNAMKHLGDLLGRMVKNKTVKRVKVGWYAINSNFKVKQTELL